MGGLNVKNTMIERVLQMVAPHPCSGCGKVGVVLCDDCKYDITHEPFVGCILCGLPQAFGICPNHQSAIEKTFVVGVRGGSLELAINRLKFQNVKAAAKPLAELLSDYLPLLPADMLVVPLPTAPHHIRQRGFDHIDLITRYFADLRTLPIIRPLVRLTNTTQHTSNKEARHQQAMVAFSLDKSIPLQGAHVLLIDDIVTTGSSIQAAAAILLKAGARVWVAVLAYQPLD